MKAVLMLLMPVAALLVAGCAGVATGADTTRLRPGMTPDEVEAVMGRPGSSQFINGQMVWKYSTHRPWVGYVPMYVAFDGQSGRLAGWSENMGEYFASQALWMDAWRSTMPPTQKVDLTVRQTR